eukprot:5741340-Prymnesium_polylepis.1
MRWCVRRARRVWRVRRARRWVARCGVLLAKALADCEADLGLERIEDVACVREHLGALWARHAIPDLPRAAERAHVGRGTRRWPAVVAVAVAVAGGGDDGGGGGGDAGGNDVSRRARP